PFCRSCDKRTSENAQSFVGISTSVVAPESGQEYGNVQVTVPDTSSFRHEDCTSVAVKRQRDPDKSCAREARNLTSTVRHLATVVPPCKLSYAGDAGTAASRWHTTVAEADSVYLFLSGLGVMIGMLEVHAANIPLAVCDQEYPYPYSERYTDVR
ncbi:hypothetical protein BaRGS_00020599, partial [Batillaria attramentaria]